MIRHITPGTIAQGIIGVQPMTGVGGSIYTKTLSRNITFKKIKFDNHWCCEFITNINEDSITAIEEWLKQFPESNYWTQKVRLYNDNAYYVNIYDEETLTAFVLRWQNSLPV